MGKPNKLDAVGAGDVARIANEQGGQAGAARHFGVSQTAISIFLRKHGYKSVTVYIDGGESVTITENGASVPFVVVDGQ